ncbi:ABC transporter permease [Candidatus Viridilinea mediisalina]|uniref:ABC transmembrane type-1 domain-containing protein n=1 Tax=Candidatus Viridilinea mediisalina TaxID=2024553 RepID=A0A2A6RDI1_9CHLR|nr:ABC transporter permease [Candidatus Viridilinea mediisalina]PDV99072.1 hypothetical protein CJ255_21730 [Candidatus Viridilinea mediisalina]
MSNASLRLHDAHALSQPTPQRSMPRPWLWLAGWALVGSFLLLALLAPWLAPHDPTAYSGAPLERPSRQHPLGTNDVGQDLLSELIYGARISLLVGVAAGGLALLIATLIGAGAGYLGGWVDLLLMRCVDLLMALPMVPLLILVVAYAGPSLLNLILCIALLGWMVPARSIRAQVLSLRSRNYIQAARLFGAGPLYVLLRHLLPALGPILLALLVGQIGRAIMIEAGIAFLGLSDPTAKSWGMMIRYALNYGGIYLSPVWIWWLLPPSLCISLLVLGFTFLGVGLERRLSPRLVRQL